MNSINLPEEAHQPSPDKLPVIGEIRWDNLQLQTLVTESEVNSFLSSFRAESDRGAVLALAAAFDEVLARALRKELQRSEPSAKLLDKVFEFNGSLGTFSARIDMARCLGLINEHLYADIHCIRKLRNEAAHQWFDFKFTEDYVKKFIDPLQSHLQHYSSDPKQDPNAEKLPMSPLVKLSTMAMQLISIGAKNVA